MMSGQDTAVRPTMARNSDSESGQAVSTQTAPCRPHVAVHVAPAAPNLHVSPELGPALGLGLTGLAGLGLGLGPSLPRLKLSP